MVTTFGGERGILLALVFQTLKVQLARHIQNAKRAIVHIYVYHKNRPDNILTHKGANENVGVERKQVTDMKGSLPKD